jgi:hypothetical protein
MRVPETRIAAGVHRKIATKYRDTSLMDVAKASVSAKARAEQA